MELKTDDTQVKFSDETSVRDSFAEYIKNNEIDRQKLLDAVNAGELVRDKKGDKLTLTFDDLNLVLADIDQGIETNYTVELYDADTNVKKYEVFSNDTSHPPLTNSQKLIYASLLLHFDFSFQTHPEMIKLFTRINELERLKNPQNNAEITALMTKMENLRHQATVLFGQELLKTDAKIQVEELHKIDVKKPETVLSKIDKFFSTPSFARDLLVGIGVGLFAAAGVTGFILLTVGTAGIGSLVLGTTAAAALGTAAATGLGFGAIALGVAGVVTTIFAGVGALLRYEKSGEPEEQPLLPFIRAGKNQMADLFDDTLKIDETPIKATPKNDSKLVSAPKRILSKIERLSEAALAELKGLEEYNTPIAKYYIQSINSGHEIKQNLGKLDGIINQMPDYDAKQTLIDYVADIRTELTPSTSTSLNF